MIIDCHIHMDGPVMGPEACLKSFDEAGVDKGFVFSYAPESNTHANTPKDPAERLKLVMDWAHKSDRVVPIFWIDPLEEDALEQVDRAVAAGIAGFKVISNRFFPGDQRPMEVWEKIAKTGKPLLFHSGILYDQGPTSNYNRPAGFEPLLDIPGLRFSLAHVSWPWHDECLAVYGKWCSRRHRGNAVAEMYIDTTPGTPKIYREQVLRKIYTIGYDIEDNVIFGTDCITQYSADYCKQIMAMDKEAFDKIGVTEAQREKYYSKNVLRFLNGK